MSPFLFKRQAYVSSPSTAYIDIHQRLVVQHVEGILRYKIWQHGACSFNLNNLHLELFRWPKIWGGKLCPPNPSRCIVYLWAGFGPSQICLPPPKTWWSQHAVAHGIFMPTNFSPLPAYLSPWLLGIISSWDLWLNPLLEDRVILGNFPNLNDIEVFSNILPEHISTKIWHEDRESEKQNCSICESKQNPMSNFPGTQMSRWHLWWTLKRFTIFPLSSQSFRDTILG